MGKDRLPTSPKSAPRQAAPRKALPRAAKQAPKTRIRAHVDKVGKGSVDHIVTEILRGLHEGRYVPGQKLIEGDLTRRFGVGRGSVREALRRLEAEGLATTSLHRGASIRIFTRDGIRDVLEVTEAIAVFAARLAADRAVHADHLGAMRKVLSQMPAHIEAGDFFAINQCRHSFMHELATLTHNQELERLWPGLSAAVVRAQFRVAFDLRMAREDIGIFQRLIDAILARDGTSAERAMRQFMRRGALAIQQLPDEHFHHWHTKARS